MRGSIVGVGWVCVCGGGGGAGGLDPLDFLGYGYLNGKTLLDPPTHTHRDTFLGPGKILSLKSVYLGWTEGTCSNECDLQICLCLRGVQGG